MQEIRRRQLIEATIDTIEAHGFADATIARISQRAGLSAGIIGHYFGGKHALLAATMRSLLDDLRRDMVSRLHRADGPVERIEAILAASFGREQFTPRVSTVWLAFYGQAPHAPELGRLHRFYARRLRSNLRHAFRALVPRHHADRAAEGMASMIDGTWVRAALADGPSDIDQAHACAHDYLLMLLERHGAGQGTRGAQPEPAETEGLAPASGIHSSSARSCP